VPPLFPPAGDARAYEAVARDDAGLAAGTREILARHGLAAADCARFEDGSLPVYAVGRTRVLKLYPPVYAGERAIESAALSAVEGRLPVPTPRVEATGTLDGWGYVLMSRLAGRPLARAWGAIPARERRRLASSLGEALSALHALPVPPPDVPRPDWASFVREQAGSAVERQRARGLGEPWLGRIEAFLAETPLPSVPPAGLLHTEVMREHLLAEEGPGGWTLTGLFDFEPAMVGAPDYEFASVGLFVASGEPGVLRDVLLAYGTPRHAIDASLSRRFLACALLHRYANLPWYLRRVPPPAGVSTLASLAEVWWPPA
jgi:hygromycin-B 7''-O-kinase